MKEVGLEDQQLGKDSKLGWTAGGMSLKYGLGGTQKRGKYVKVWGRYSVRGWNGSRIFVPRCGEA